MRHNVKCINHLHGKSHWKKTINKTQLNYDKKTGIDAEVFRTTTSTASIIPHHLYLRQLCSVIQQTVEESLVDLSPYFSTPVHVVTTTESLTKNADPVPLTHQDHNMNNATAYEVKRKIWKSATGGAYWANETSVPLHKINLLCGRNTFCP